MVQFDDGTTCALERATMAPSMRRQLCAVAPSTTRFEASIAPAARALQHHEHGTD